MPHYNKKRKRQRGGKGNHGPPHKKRRDNNFQNKLKLSPEEKKAKCLSIIKTLEQTLQSESIDLLTLPKLTEYDVGIQLFINNEKTFHKPIIANLKHKYEDFIVSEIDESGNVVKIISDQLTTDNANSINKDATISDAITKVSQQLSSLITAEKANNFIQWYKDSIKTKHNINIADSTTDKKENENDDIKMTDDNNKKMEIQNFVFDANKNKQERTAIHKLLRNLQYISTKTNDKSCIEVQIIKGKFAKERWPKSRGAYLKFILTKCGIDTTQCLNTINRNLYKKSSKTFSIAGTKDKHAITSQVITAYHVTCDEMKNAVKTMNNVRVGNFEYVREEIKLGCLKGNGFKIALRNIEYYKDDSEKTERKTEPIEVEQNELTDRLDILNNIGFINYFGMQRFGCSTVGTHFIGKAIVTNKLAFALALMVLPRAGESERFEKERQAFIESGDIALFPYGLWAEKKCIYGLLENEGDYQQAFKNLPRNVRTMYAHSYQSYIWNHCVSRRVEKYGYKAVIGDVVRLKNMVVEKNGEGRDVNDDFEYVSEGNVGKYDIFDVVFPLVSPGIILPKVKGMVEYMEELLKKDGMTLDGFNRLDTGMWGINANYRNIVVKPKNLKGEVKMYGDDDELLIDVPFESKTGNNSNNKEGVDGERKIAWIVSFELQKSCYATMLMRQLLFIGSDKLKR